jgi:hypothetical protein
MDLGSVSYPPANVEHFQQAVRYLRDAADGPGFALPEHLRRYVLLEFFLLGNVPRIERAKLVFRYVDEYGCFVD